MKKCEDCDGEGTCRNIDDEFHEEDCFMCDDGICNSCEGTGKVHDDWVF